MGGYIPASGRIFAGGARNNSEYASSTRRRLFRLGSGPLLGRAGRKWAYDDVRISLPSPLTQPVPLPPILLVHSPTRARRRRRGAKEEKGDRGAAAMGVMGRLKIFVVKEPVVAASCLIAGFGLFLPAVVRPMLDSWETEKNANTPVELKDVVAGVTGKKTG